MEIRHLSLYLSISSRCKHTAAKKDLSDRDSTVQQFYMAMNRNIASSFREPRSLPAENTRTTSRPDFDERYSQDNTVIIGRSIGNGDGSSDFPSRPEYPEFAHFYNDVRPLHLEFASPVQPSIDAVLWQANSPASGLNNDGIPTGTAEASSSRGRFTPWTGSTRGAQAWSHADEVEAIRPSREEMWLATRFRRYLIGICCALYLVATLLLIVVCLIRH